ncbi:MAG TPA: PQQ-binding-like beta-propeller repeat protein, partial [Ktedonosporobacter sp.]|nr:PQQ-binding-like beta-propeller repeat protein [Ktedonosporobacter sp.]
PPLRVKVPSLAPEVEQVVLTAMAKDPKQRFANVKIFAHALQQAWQSSVTYPLVLRLPSTLPGQEAQPAGSGIPSQPHTSSHNLGPMSSMSSQGNISGITPGQGSMAGMPMQGNMNSMVNLPGQASQPGIVGISGLGELDEVAPTVLVTPSRQVGTNTAGEQLSFPGIASLPQQAMIPSAEEIDPPSKRVSRRSLLIGGVATAIVAVAGIAGGSLLLRRSGAGIATPIQTQAPSIPNPVIFGLNPQHTRYNLDEHVLSPVNVTRLTQIWATPTGGVIGISSPTVVNGVLYIGNFAGKLIAMQAATGKILWTITVGQINSTPAFDNGIIYVGALDQNIYAVSATDGKILWATTLGGKISASPVLGKGNIYIGASDGKLYAISASTGRVQWVADTGTVNLLISSPALDKNVLYLGSWDGKLYAFDAIHGKKLWSTPTAGPIFSSPTVAGGVVYVGSRDGKLYACDAATGRILWTVSTTNLIASSPAIANGMVYFGSKDGKLYAVEIATGTVRWWVRTGGEVDSSPLVANGVVYFGSWDYTLYAANAITGDMLWKKTTGQPIESSPTVVNGVLYVGSNDQKVYAFALPSAIS